MNSKAQDCLSGFADEISKLNLTNLEMKHLLDEIYMTFFTNDSESDHSDDSVYSPPSEESSSSDEPPLWWRGENYEVIDLNDDRYKDHQHLL